MSGSNWLRGIIAGLMAAAVGIPSAVGLGIDAAVAARADGTAARADAATIDALILQLGDPQYHAREKAQEDLRRLGTAAFDALLAAQDHVDVEIAMRARYLVRSMAVEWTKEGDAPELKQMFRDYSSRDREERATRARHFASLDSPSAVAALCRIVRFDVDRVLSKEAAVLILNGEWPDSEAARLRRAEQIEAEIALSTRKGADWLRLYVRTLQSPSGTEGEWGTTIGGELEQLARHPEDSNRKLVTDLIRWHTHFLLRLGREEQALVSVRRAFDLLGDDLAELYEMLDWSVENNLHRVADEMAARFAESFHSDPRLLYRLAESQLKRGEEQTAAATAARARELEPERMDRHLALARYLQFRVLTDWAESEYRFVVERSKPTDIAGAKGRWWLMELLFDMQREKEAAEMARALVEAASQSPRVLDYLDDPEPGHLHGYMEYYFGMHFARAGDVEKQREHLRKAISHWPENPDFIIAMYRVRDADEAWRKDVKHRIDAFVGELQGEIRGLEATMQQPMNDDERSRNGEYLAGRLNELAWLISNTEGDFREAVRMSERSLELRPDNPAYLDTLGRCYYAAGDYEKAVKAQSRAVKLMPSMFVMRRQLSLLEKALAESKAQPGETPSAGKDNG